MDDVFVLLDDCNASTAVPASRLYSGFVREHRCTNPQTLAAVWRDVEIDQQIGLHSVVFADYEWGAKLQRAGHLHLHADDKSALRILMFNTLQRLTVEAVGLWLAQQDESDTPSPAGICDLSPSENQVRFEAQLAQIQALIRRGETYQVNYTLRMTGSQYGNPIALYRRLRMAQPVAYGALAKLPPCSDETNHALFGPATWVLSSSPELFVRNHANQLLTRPMKGTAARHAEPAEDRARARWLATDAKNRAENVMIVDLLRNDLGRIAETGSVKVPQLFTVESFKTVHQMTSTVSATLRRGVRFPEVMRALFPCGSITGAPKLHTMDLISNLEGGRRGIYCGAIGWVDAPTPQSPTGDFCLSVAIRTMVLGVEKMGRRPAVVGVGNGIVMDSNPQEEFAEVRTKLRYLTTMDPGFTLFETMQVSRGKLRHLKEHLRRLRASAWALGFVLDEKAMQIALVEQLQMLDASQRYRLRMDLQHDGQIKFQASLLVPLASAPAQLLLAKEPVPMHEAALLNHKTSLRSSYDAAIQCAMTRHAFDVIHLNSQGEVTEGARSTLFAKIDDFWVTPALSSGVLAGVMRQRLLQRFPQIRERVLRLDEVLSASQLAVCSALRGLQHAQWMKDAKGAPQRV